MNALFLVRRAGLVAGPLLALASFLLLPDSYASDVIFLFLGGFILGLVIDLVGRARPGEGESAVDAAAQRNFATGLLLAVAYSSSIGGIATLIGSPPNGIAARFIAQTWGDEVTFLQWMGLGMPFTIIFLPIAWFLLTRVLFPAPFREVAGGREMMAAQYEKLGPMGRGEKVTLSVFAAAAFLWIFGELLRPVAVAGVRPFAGLTDSGVAMLAAA